MTRYREALSERHAFITRLSLRGESLRKAELAVELAKDFSG